MQRGLEGFGCLLIRLVILCCEIAVADLLRVQTCYFCCSYQLLSCRWLTCLSTAVGVHDDALQSTPGLVSAVAHRLAKPAGLGHPVARPGGQMQVVQTREAASKCSLPEMITGEVDQAFAELLHQLVCSKQPQSATLQTATDSAHMTHAQSTFATACSVLDR